MMRVIEVISKETAIRQELPFISETQARAGFPIDMGLS
jgi:hypothetical protein